LQIEQLVCMNIFAAEHEQLARKTPARSAANTRLAPINHLRRHVGLESSELECPE